MRRALLSFVLFFVLGARVAGAQEDPRRAQAAPFFEEARRLAEKNQNAESLEKFRKAYSIFGSPNTLFNIARQEQLLGQRLAALRDYREALRNPVLLYQFASQARGYVSELEAVTGRVQVVGPDGTQVTVAGSAYKLPLAAPIDVEPGAVQVVGSHGTDRFDTVAEAKAGTTVTVTLVPLTTGTTPATPPPTEPPHEPIDKTTFWGLRSIGGLVLVATGAVFIGLSFAAASDESTKKSEAVQLKGQVPPGQDGCTRTPISACGQLTDALTGRNDASGRMLTYRWVGVPIAIVGAGLVASAVVWPARKTSGSARFLPRVLPLAGPREAGLLFTSTF